MNLFSPLRLAVAFLPWLIAPYFLPAVQPSPTGAEKPSAKIRTEPVYGHWRACTIGDGGYHQQVVFCPTNPYRYYTYIDTAGVFRSDDAGETWRLITAHMEPRPRSYDVRAVAVDPRNEDVILAAFGNSSGIYRSTDGGGSWKCVLPDVTFYGNGPVHWCGPALAFQPGNPDVVLAASQGTGLFKSTDGGQTWTKKGLEGIYATNVLFDAKNPRAAWVCAVPAAPKWDPPGDYHGGFYSTEDAGETWQPLATEPPPYKMVQDSADPDTFHAIFLEGTQVRVSHDRGKSWADCTEGLDNTPPKPGDPASDTRYRSLAVGPDFVLCGSFHGSIYRLDHGQSAWKKVVLEEVSYDDRRWSTAEHPGQWPPDPFGRAHFFGSAMSNIMIDPRDPAHWIITDWYAVYQSRDAGRTWRSTIDGIESTAILGLRQDPSDPRRVYLNMSDNGYFASDDGGTRFKKPTPDFPSGDVKSIDLSPKQPARVWATGNKEGGIWASNQLFVSTDHGANWKHAPMTGLPDSGPPNQPSTAPESHRFNVVAVAPEHPDVLLVAASGVVAPGQGGVYRSTDGGTSWSWFGKGLEGKVFSGDFWTYDNQIVIGPDGTALLVGATDKTPYRLDGETWVPIKLATEKKAVRLAADWHRKATFYLGVPGSGVFLSQDGGLNWRLIHPFSGSIQALETDHARAGVVAFSTADTIFYSPDNGRTWVDLDPGHSLPCLPAKCLAFAGNRILMGTHNCGAYWTELPK